MRLVPSTCGQPLTVDSLRAWMAMARFADLLEVDSSISDVENARIAARLFYRGLPNDGLAEISHWDTVVRDHAWIALFSFRAVNAEGAKISPRMLREHADFIAALAVPAAVTEEVVS